MRSTMQEFQLTIGAILRHGTEVNGDSEVDHGDRRRLAPETYAEVGRARPGWRTPCARSASTATSGSATFQWNNAEHLEAYLAVPAMGAVLHTLNIRLFPEQLDLHRQPRRGQGRHRRRLARRRCSRSSCPR